MFRLSATALLFAALTFARSGHTKLASDLEALDDQTDVSVIVRWKTSAEANDKKVAGKGGIVGLKLDRKSLASYRIKARSAKELAGDPDVEHISLDHPIGARLDNTAAAINAKAAWSAGIVGSGVGVAILDSGISPASDLGEVGPLLSRVVYSEDFTPSKKGAKSSTSDRFGHGQHIAGIIGSNGFSSTCWNCTRSFIGAAPGANLINLRVLDENGQGSDSLVIAAVERAIELKDKFNIRIINLSLGRPVFKSFEEDPLCQAVEAAWKAGIVVVVSAGNDGRDNSFGNFGYGTIEAPGNDPYVITVGAMRSVGTPSRTDDLIASYSSKGPTQVDHIVKPDLVAPGNLVVSLAAPGSTLHARYPSNAVPVSYYKDTHSKKVSDEYFTLSGTSMAAAVVSGAAALVLQANPKLSPDQVKLLLMRTAYKTFPTTSSVYDDTTKMAFTSYYDLFTVGAGYLDVGAALAVVASVPEFVNAASPTAAYEASTGIVNIVLKDGSVDTSRTFWGRDAIWSSSVLQGLTCVWDSRTVWGAASNFDDQGAIWGARTIWGRDSVEGLRTIWGRDSVDSLRTVWGRDSIEVQGDR